MVARDQRPYTTIFADASLCQKTGAAGWGAWVVCNDRAPATYGGPLRTPFVVSTDAELAALANALVMAKAGGFLAPETVVMLQSDSLGALGLIMAKFRAEDRPMKDRAEGRRVVPVERGVRRKGQRHGAARLKFIRAALEGMAAIREELNLSFAVRHVKGHRNKQALSGKDGRAWVNKECDRLARRGMEAARRAVAAQLEKTDVPNSNG